MIKQRHPHGILLKNNKRNKFLINNNNDPVVVNNNDHTPLVTRKKKSQRPFISYVALWIMFISIIVWLYTVFNIGTWIMKSSKEKERHVVEQLLSIDNCSNILVDDDKSASRKGNRVTPKLGTMSCPCGRLTPEKYRGNMVELYGDGTYNIKEIERCLSLSLPLKLSDPSECRPKIIILPSHYTNGSQLARLLLNHGMGIQGIFDHYKDGRHPYIFFDFGQSLKLETRKQTTREIVIYNNCDQDLQRNASYPIPIMNQPVIFKTHIGMTGRQFSDDSMISREIFDGVIRLARNPGDQILRNKVRWSDHARDKFYEENEERYRSKICRKLSHTNYLHFHSFWNDIDKNIPQAIMYYEEFSNPAKAVRVADHMMDFLNVTKRKTNDLAQIIQDIVKEPTYVHGTLMAKWCGKDKAREIHELTKMISEPLGYYFDNETATWSLKH